MIMIMIKIIYSDQRSILGSDKERFRKVNQ